MQEVKLIASAPEFVFALSGDIDSGNSEDFYNEVMTEYLQSPAEIVFDCKSLNFIDSTTLGTFVKVHNQVKKKGNRVKLVNLQPRLKKLFVICALDTVMEIA